MKLVVKLLEQYLVNQNVCHSMVRKILLFVLNINFTFILFSFLCGIIDVISCYYFIFIFLISLIQWKSHSQHLPVLYLTLLLNFTYVTFLYLTVNPLRYSHIHLIKCSLYHLHFSLYTIYLNLLARSPFLKSDHTTIPHQQIISYIH